jgi:thioredoxin
MNRRRFLASSAALVAAGPVLAANGTAYSEGLVEKELAAGKTVFVDFYTDWCSTCRAQGKTIAALMAENPAYEQNISFIKVDWDVYSQSELAKRLNIPRRSTLVVLKGDRELGRIVAGTQKSKIKALMDAALDAAMV